MSLEFLTRRCVPWCTGHMRALLPWERPKSTANLFWFQSKDSVTPSPSSRRLGWEIPFQNGCFPCPWRRFFKRSLLIPTEPTSDQLPEAREKKKPQKHTVDLGGISCPVAFSLSFRCELRFVRKNNWLSSILGNYGNKLSHWCWFDKKQTTETTTSWGGSSPHPLAPELTISQAVRFIWNILGLKIELLCKPYVKQVKTIVPCS